MSLNIFLVDPAKSIRQAVGTQLESEGRISILGETASPTELLSALNRVKPNVILMNIVDGSQEPLTAIRKVKAGSPDTKVLAMAGSEQAHLVLELLDAGADSVVLNNVPKEELLFSMRKIHNGGRYVSAEFTLQLLSIQKESNGHEKKLTPEELKISEREMAVLKLVAEGLTNNEIAERLYTSRRTIETRRKNLLDKTGTTNTATLIKFAVKHHLIN